MIRPPRSLQELNRAVSAVEPDPDMPFEAVDDVLTLRPALQTLGARERRNGLRVCA
jgi:hypothetical protein